MCLPPFYICFNTTTPDTTEFQIDPDLHDVDCNIDLTVLAPTQDHQE